jgi:hypothetical protein
LAEYAEPVRDRVRRCAVEEPDHRHRLLLRARRQRPRGRRAASGHAAAAPPRAKMNARRPMKAVI